MITIRVPATTANLGPGYDSLGMALSLYNMLIVSLDEMGEVIIEGEGAGRIPADGRNLVIKSYRLACERMGKQPLFINLRQVNGIPPARGLGSSASAVVGGILAADALHSANWTKEQILRLAAEIEGHPDNVAPAIYGGFTVAIQDAQGAKAIRLTPPEDLSIIAIIPLFSLTTKRARAVLPSAISHSDAAFNVGRSSYLVAAMTEGKLSELSVALEDKLHQPYRSTMIEGYDDVIEACKDAGALGSFLSGAGPTIMALVHKGYQTEFIENLSKHQQTLKDWRISPLSFDSSGASVEPTK